MQGRKSLFGFVHIAISPSARRAIQSSSRRVVSVSRCTRPAKTRIPKAKLTGGMSRLCTTTVSSHSRPPHALPLAPNGALRAMPAHVGFAVPLGSLCSDELRLARGDDSLNHPAERTCAYCLKPFTGKEKVITLTVVRYSTHLCMLGMRPIQPRGAGRKAKSQLHFTSTARTRTSSQTGRSAADATRRSCTMCSW
jgi:hypothetical protein